MYQVLEMHLSRNPDVATKPHQVLAFAIDLTARLKAVYHKTQPATMENGMPQLQPQQRTIQPEMQYRPTFVPQRAPLPPQAAYPRILQQRPSMQPHFAQMNYPPPNLVQQHAATMGGAGIVGGYHRFDQQGFYDSHGQLRRFAPYVSADGKVPITFQNNA